MCYRMYCTSSGEGCSACALPSWGSMCLWRPPTPPRPRRRARLPDAREGMCCIARFRRGMWCVWSSAPTNGIGLAAVLWSAWWWCWWWWVLWLQTAVAGRTGHWTQSLFCSPHPHTMRSIFPCVAARSARCGLHAAQSDPPPRRRPHRGGPGRLHRPRLRFFLCAVRQDCRHMPPLLPWFKALPPPVSVKTPAPTVKNTTKLKPLFHTSN